MTQQSFLLSQNITLAGTWAGQEPETLVLIHGWTCRRSDWETTLEALQDRHRLLALDLPGHGDSADQTPTQWTVAAMAALVAETVQQHVTGPVVLAGHSMGGAVALEAALLLQNPQLKGVILVDTFALPYGDISEEQARDIEHPFQDNFAVAIEGLVENFSAATLTPASKNTLKQQMSAADPAFMLPLWNDLLRWNPEPALSGLTVPIHAINGDLIPLAAKDRCEQRIKEWHLEGAGHFPQWEMPDRFHQCLAEVMATL
ncbi:MAG: alpha/beta hydrolase [Halomonadaceae bacterium]|nr:MAG: alpha/beta hydrolase [Halomonadaceae bacterium]